jgi:hypothetical protein
LSVGRASQGARELLEIGRHDRDHGLAASFEGTAVVDTPRRACPSGTEACNYDINVASEVVELLLRRAYPEGKRGGSQSRDASTLPREQVAQLR